MSKYETDENTIKILIDATVNSIRDLYVVVDHNKDALKRLEEKAQKHEDFTGEVIKELDEIRTFTKDVPLILNKINDILSKCDSLKIYMDRGVGNDEDGGMTHQFQSIYSHVMKMNKVIDIIKNPISIAFGIMIVLGTLFGMYEGFMKIYDFMHILKPH